MIIGLSGYAQSGKDTIANHLVEHHGFTRLAFADPIREALYALNPSVTDIPELQGVSLQWIVDKMGWDFAKVDSPQVRRLLQRFGTEVGRELWGENFWVDKAMATAAKYDKVVIADVRYPNEYEAIKSANGKMWRVIKPGTEAVNKHESETALDDFLFDRVIPNVGTLGDLQVTVNYLVRD
jgi:hypothetical protein